MEKIWLHGDGCDCDKCNKNGDRYIVYDNEAATYEGDGLI